MAVHSIYLHSHAGTAALQVHQSVTIAGFLHLDALQLQLSPSGMNATVQGKLVDVPMVVSMAVARNGQYNFTAGTTGDLSAVDLMSAVWPSVPSALVSFLRPIRFSAIKVSYSSQLRKFGLLALPDIKGSVLANVVEGLGLSASDIMVRENPLNGLPELALAKIWVFEIGAPFVGKSEASFAVAVQPCDGTVCFSMDAAFRASIRLVVLDPEVISFSLEAGVKFGGTSQTAFTIGLSTPNTLQLKGFPFVKVKGIAGRATMALGPMRITQIAFQGSVEVLAMTRSVSLFYDQRNEGLAMRFTIDRFDLEGALRSLGIPVSLGPFNLEVTGVEFSFAMMETNDPLISPPIPAGLKLAGGVSFLGMTATINFEMKPTGVDFAFRVDRVSLLAACLCVCA
jgi:hypothetical protein